MTNIRFRAWDKKEKRMFPVMNLYFEDIGQCVDEEPNNKRHLFDNIILMQYTGLKDKKGKEIYEGDIVKNTRFKNKLVEIYWEGIGEGSLGWTRFGGWGFRRLKGDKRIGKKAMFHGDIEIIGNVWENKELLKDGV